MPKHPDITINPRRYVSDIFSRAKGFYIVIGHSVCIELFSELFLGILPFPYSMHCFNRNFKSRRPTVTGIIHIILRGAFV